MKNLKLLTLLCTVVLAPALYAQIDCSVSDNFQTSSDKNFKNISNLAENLKGQLLELKPFYTDGCTMFVDGTSDQPNLWRNCCVEHDLRYWFGGSKKEMDETDLRLKSCVEKVAGAYWAKIIYMGVRTGHHSPVKNKTQWNWGWKEKREYAALSLLEASYVKEQLKSMSVPEVDMDEFLKVNFP